jgi:hypothetical protein
MPKKQRNSSGYSPRTTNTRDIKQRFLIVCEGEKTEPNYFRSFRVSKLVIHAKGFGENPSKIVERAIEESKRDTYDQIWCVFDRDSWTTDDFNSAIAAAQQLKFNVAYSNEAFELWYILHFEFLNTGISRKDYNKRLTTLLGRPYEKKSGDMYDELFSKQTTAIANAEKLFRQYNRPDPANDNPSTTVHLLVQQLNRFIS